MGETANTDRIVICTEITRADWEAYGAGEASMEAIAQGDWQERATNEQADLLDRAVSLLIVRQLEAGDCPHERCPHDPFLRPDREFGDTVCEECWRQAILSEAKQQAEEREQDG